MCCSSVHGYKCTYSYIGPHAQHLTLSFLLLFNMYIKSTTNNKNPVWSEKVKIPWARGNAEGAVCGGEEAAGDALRTTQ